MSAFRCVPIDTATATRFRWQNTDDGGNVIARFTAGATSNMPCRHCLAMARPGDVMMLGSYGVPQPSGIYQSSSPVFIHESDCPRFSLDNVIAPIVLSNPLVSIRSYDADHYCIYDLGVVCPGDAVEAPLRRALADV